MAKETLEEKTYRLCVTVFAEQHPKAKPLLIDDPSNDKDVVRFYNRLVELTIAEEREACIKIAEEWLEDCCTPYTLGAYITIEREK